MTEDSPGTTSRFRLLPEDPAGHGMMLLVALIYGLNYVIGRWAVGEVPAYTLGFTRWAVGTLLLLPFAWKAIRNDWQTIRDSWQLFVMAGCAMPFVGSGITYVALNYTTAINGSVIQTSLPIAIVFLSWLFLGEGPRWIQLVGAAIAIIGVLSIISQGDVSILLGLTFNVGDAILIVCNLGLAAYGVIVKRIPGGLHPLSLLTVVCGIGAAFHAPFFAAEILSGEVPRPGWTAVLSLLFVAIFPSVVGVICWNTAIFRIGLNRSGFYMYLVPAFAALFAIPLLGERVGSYHLLGFALIVAGVTLSARKDWTFRRG